MSDPVDRLDSALTSEQLEFASDLGLEPQQGEGVDGFIQRIEQELGQNSLLELARWFLFSVMRHLKQDTWHSLGACGVDKKQQYQLAAEYIATDELKKSLLVVLKDPRCRFVILGFAKSRDPAQRVLSSTTKAFRHAKELLIQHDLVDARMVSRRGRRPAAKQSAEVNTVARRRAARRAPSSVSPAVDVASDDTGSGSKSAIEMSEEEFAELDAVLEAGDVHSSTPWTYQSSDERVSLLLGVLAGAGLFAVVLWLFF